MAVIGDPKSDSSEDIHAKTNRLASKADAETGMELELLTSSQEELILRDLNVQAAMTQYTKQFNLYNCKVDFHGL